MVAPASARKDVIEIHETLGQLNETTAVSLYTTFRSERKFQKFYEGAFIRLAKLKFCPRFLPLRSGRALQAGRLKECHDNHAESGVIYLDGTSSGVCSIKASNHEKNP